MAQDLFRKGSGPPPRQEVRASQASEPAAPHLARYHHYGGNGRGYAYYGGHANGTSSRPRRRSEQAGRAGSVDVEHRHREEPRDGLGRCQAVDEGGRHLCDLEPTGLPQGLQRRPVRRGSGAIRRRPPGWRAGRGSRVLGRPHGYQQSRGRRGLSVQPRRRSLERDQVPQGQRLRSVPGDHPRLRRRRRVARRRGGRWSPRRRHRDPVRGRVVFALGFTQRQRRGVRGPALRRQLVRRGHAQARDHRRWGQSTPTP